MNYLEIARSINHSAMFLTTCVGITAQNKKDYNFIQSYLMDETRPYEDSIYAVFKPSNVLTFQIFVENEKFRTPLLIDYYEIEDFKVLVYKLPEKYKGDYEKFRNGAYSTFSEEFKQFFPKMVKIYRGGVRDESPNILYMIINKDKKLKDYWEERLDERIDGEVWSIPDMEREKLKKYESITESLTESGSEGTGIEATL